jgi:hypothetical protein
MDIRCEAMVEAGLADGMTQCQGSMDRQKLVDDGAHEP